MDNNETWDALLELGVEEQTLKIVVAINGYTKKTLMDILYAHTGHNTLEQMDEEDEDR